MTVVITDGVYLHIVPDLAFSEMKFLDGKHCGPTTDETTPKYKRDSRSQRFENEISSYFDSSKRRLHDVKPDTTTVPSYNCPGPRKRLRQRNNSLDARSPEFLTPTSPKRTSPRSAMAEALRRRGVYSLPANQSSRGSSSDSNFLQTDTAEDPDRDADDHSEYSRKGFQTRFKDDTKGPTDLHAGKNCTRSSTDGHTTRRLELIKDKHNHGLEGELTGTMVRTEEVKTNEKTTVEQVSDTSNPTLVPKMPPASKRSCTPEPSWVERNVSPKYQLFCSAQSHIE